MKNLFALAAVAGLSLGLVGCSDDDAAPVAPAGGPEGTSGMADDTMSSVDSANEMPPAANTPAPEGAE